VNLPPPPANAAAFVDVQHGWVGGAAGLLGTTDGRIFRVESRAPVVSISAFDRARAWALTGDGFVLGTSDGTHWRRLGAPHLIQLQFVDPRVGYGLTRDGVLVRSRDAGVTWRESRDPALVQSECFSTRRDGWVARGGSVWTTHDAGGHWTAAALRARSGTQELPQLACHGGDVWVVFTEGAAAGTVGYHVFRSLHGGPWRAVLASSFQSRLPSVSNYIGPSSVLGAGRAVFSGSCDPCGPFGTLTVARTSDGGASFQRRASLRGYQPRALAFVDAESGWLVTGGHAGSATAPRLGILWRTRDGGRHWRAVLRSPLLRS